MSSYIFAYILPHIYTAMNMKSPNMADHQIIALCALQNFHIWLESLLSMMVTQEITIANISLSACAWRQSVVSDKQQEGDAILDTGGRRRF